MTLLYFLSGRALPLCSSSQPPHHFCQDFHRPPPVNPSSNGYRALVFLNLLQHLCHQLLLLLPWSLLIPPQHSPNSHVMRKPNISFSFLNIKS